MVTGSVVALLIKMIPYVIAMKVVGGAVDVGIHYTKLKINKQLATENSNSKLEVY
jgi:hypothetical protein